MERMKPGRAKRSPMVMFPKKKMEARDRMTWLLDFLNVDIDSLKRGDLLKLLYDFTGFSYGLDYPFPKLPGMWGTPEERILLKRSQTFLRKALREILRAYSGTYTRLEILEEYSYSVPFQVLLLGDRVFKVRSTGSSSLWPPVYDEDFQALLFDAMVELLNQFPLSRIKTCQKPDCVKYFYQKTTKNLGFCSDRCSRWRRQKKYVKNNPEKINRYQREYRAKAKADRIKLKCPSRLCGYQGREEVLEDYLKRYSEAEECPQCKKTKSLHIVLTWNQGEWVEDVYTVDEWEKYLKKYK